MMFDVWMTTLQHSIAEYFACLHMNEGQPHQQLESMTTTVLDVEELTVP